MVGGGDNVKKETMNSFLCGGAVGEPRPINAFGGRMSGRPKHLIGHRSGCVGAPAVAHALVIAFEATISVHAYFVGALTPQREEVAT